MYLLLAAVAYIFYTNTPVFFNTSPSTYFSTNNLLLLPTPAQMDVFKEATVPAANNLSIPVSLVYHHFSMDTMQNSVHFGYHTDMEQLKMKQRKSFMLQGTKGYKHSKPN